MLNDKLEFDVVAFGFEYVRYIHIFAKWLCGVAGPR